MAAAGAGRRAELLGQPTCEGPSSWRYREVKARRASASHLHKQPDLLGSRNHAGMPTATSTAFLVGAARPGQDGFSGHPKAGVTSLPARPSGSHCPGQVGAAGQTQRPRASLASAALPRQTRLEEKESGHRQALMMTANIMTHIIQSAPLQM